MSLEESTSLAPRDKPNISHTNHPETSKKTKKVRQKATTTHARTSRAKQKARDGDKLDDPRKITNTGRTNQTDPTDRRKALCDDEWAASVQPHIVRCKACQKPIKLDVRYGQYYRSNWNKHKESCKKIKEARKKNEAITIEAKRSNDGNMCSHMDIDSDRQSKTEPGVTRKDSPNVTSVPKMANAFLVANAKSEKLPPTKFVENPFKNVKENVGGVPPYLTYKFARYTSRDVIMLDQSVIELLAAHREHLNREP